jgi:hypothetical protein
LKIFETKGLILKLTEAQISGQQVEDIDDPLYGNMGGPEELELLREVYQDLQDSCEGLLQFLMETKTSLQGSETLKQGIARTLGQMESLDWLVPPMLQRA